MLLADGELPDARTRLDSEAETPRELVDALLDRARLQQERAADVALVAEHDVLGDGEGRHEPEVLVDHRDARVDRVTRRLELDRLAEEHDLALVRPVEAREDVRQRRLAGAVLSQQGVHLADGGLEVDAVVRDDRGKPLGDSPQRDGRVRGRGSLAFPAHRAVSPWRYR